MNPSDVEQPELPERIWLHRGGLGVLWMQAKRQEGDIEYARVSPVPAEDGAAPSDVELREIADRINAGIERMEKSQKVDPSTYDITFGPPTKAPDLAVGDAARERDLLAEAIIEAAVKVGITDGSHTYTGPELLLLCQDLSRDLPATPDAVAQARRETWEAAITLLLEWRKWYSEDLFRPWTVEEAKIIHGQFPGAVDRISADSARGVIDNIAAALRAEGGEEK